MKKQPTYILPIIILMVSTLVVNNIYSQELIPLKKGNKWIYLQEEYINNRLIRTDTITSEVGPIVIFNNKEWFYMKELGSEYFVRNNKYGQFEVDTLNVDESGAYKEVLMFKKNDYTKPISYLVYENTKVTVESEPKTIKSIAGDFECLVYRLESKLNESIDIYEIYISPGTGIISHTCIEGSNITRSQLIDYKLH